MPDPKISYHDVAPINSPVLREEHIEYGFIGTLQKLKYEYRPDITNRAALEANFREKFEALNRVRLTDSEFARLLDEIVTPDVFTASKTLRSISSFTRDDGTPLNYTLVNIKDWCKNTFEVIDQMTNDKVRMTNRVSRTSTLDTRTSKFGSFDIRNSEFDIPSCHHRYDVILLINGVPCVQIELKTLGISPRRAMEQIVEFKHDPGNGYTKTLLCFMQLFIVSNRIEIVATDSGVPPFDIRNSPFEVSPARHFAFNADERFLPVYQMANAEVRMWN